MNIFYVRLQKILAVRSWTHELLRRISVVIWDETNKVFLVDLADILDVPSGIIQHDFPKEQAIHGISLKSHHGVPIDGHDNLNNSELTPIVESI